jgi:hypothetical protein
MVKTYTNLYPKLCSYKNIERAFKKASKGKNSKFYVKMFRENLVENLLQIKREARRNCQAGKYHTQIKAGGEK